jgi:hypothetical protein
MEDESEALQTFQAITGADFATAEHVLEAHGWDLNKGVNFFMESSGSATASLPAREERPRFRPGASIYSTELLYVIEKQFRLSDGMFQLTSGPWKTAIQG